MSEPILSARGVSFRYPGAEAPALEDIDLVLRPGRTTAFIGSTGSGKTTLLNVLSNLIPQGERLITIEDAAELKLNHPHLVSLESRPPNAEGRGSITIRDLVKNALRMRPDRIIVGECRGAEALDMAQAMNTGHEGGCGTVHANSVADVPARLEALAALGGMGREACHAQIGAALDAVIHVRRGADGQRGVGQIGVVRSGDDGRVRIDEALVVAADGVSRPAGQWSRLAELSGVPS